MNAYFITLCAMLQVLILSANARWPAATAYSLVLVMMVAMFAFTRERWDAHLDMVLLMAGPGGLGMMAAMALGPACHVQLTWTSYGVMSAGMLLLSVPLGWRSARCVRQARRDGYGGRALLLDVAGMQLGMTFSHLAMGILPLVGPRAIWWHHGLMMAGMLLGMLASMGAWRYALRRGDSPSLGQLRGSSLRRRWRPAPSSRW